MEDKESGQRESFFSPREKKIWGIVAATLGTSGTITAFESWQKGAENPAITQILEKMGMRADLAENIADNAGLIAATLAMSAGIVIMTRKVIKRRTLNKLIDSAGEKIRDLTMSSNDALKPIK